MSLALCKMEAKGPSNSLPAELVAAADPKQMVCNAYCNVGVSRLVVKALHDQNAFLSNWFDAFFKEPMSWTDFTTRFVPQFLSTVAPHQYAALFSVFTKADGSVCVDKITPCLVKCGIDEHSEEKIDKFLKGGLELVGESKETFIRPPQDEKKLGPLALNSRLCPTARRVVLLSTNSPCANHGSVCVRFQNI